MLCQFSFENFKCFKKEAFLDLFAEPISEHERSLLVDIDQEKFLPVISIYGPNGGGKSTVLEALRFLRQTVIKPVIAVNMNDDLSLADKQLITMSFNGKGSVKYHRYDKACEQLPMSFEIMFRVNGYQYKYELSLIKTNIVKENFYYNEIGKEDVTLVFERDELECVTGEEISSISFTKIKNSMPLLSYIASSYDVHAVNEAIAWFSSIHIMDYDQPLNDYQIQLPKQVHMQSLFFKMLDEMDIHISDIRVEKDFDGNIKDIYTKHIIHGETVELLIQDESSGTRKILSCLLRLIECLEKGEVIIADELDAKLHPKLLRFIISLFTSPLENKKGAQLLITSHDIVNMNPDVFRRDEIWFCTLETDYASSLYSLISFREENGKPPRKDAVYGKRYLEGKYGADPYIKNGVV